MQTRAIQRSERRKITNIKYTMKSVKPQEIQRRLRNESRMRMRGNSNIP